MGAMRMGRVTITIAAAMALLLPGSAMGVESGDFDGDGRGDLAIGVPGESISGVAAAGAVSVLYGSATGLDAGADDFFTQADGGIGGTRETNDNFGTALAAGDFDGDGFDDLAVGTPSEVLETTDLAGVIQVIHGSRHGLRGHDSYDIDQDDFGGDIDESDQFGQVLTVGDFGGGPTDDLAVGVPSEDLEGPGIVNAGAVDVLYGSSSDGLEPAVADTLTQANLGSDAEIDDTFGQSLAAANFGGERHDDLAVGVPLEDFEAVPPNPANDRVNAGLVHVVQGSDDGVTSSGVQTLSQVSVAGDGPQSDDRFGAALAAANLGRSGRGDLAIGSPGESLEDAVPPGSDRDGAVHVAYGSATGPKAEGSQVWNQDSPGVAGTAQPDLFGNSLAAGNVGRGGFGDLAIGVRGETEDAGPGAGNGAGAVNVLYGRDNGLAAAGNQIWSQGTEGIEDTPDLNDFFGDTLAIADLGRGRTGDLAVGVGGEDLDPPNNAGVVNAIYATKKGLRARGDELWSQNSPGVTDFVEQNDAFGLSLAP